MFDREYAFRGKHCDYVNKLTAKFNSSLQLFRTNGDVYLIAPIVGFLYGRKSELDKKDNTAKIFTDKLIKEQENLKFNYRLIMLLDENNEKDINERINKAFRYYGTEKAKADEALYESYVRGGVEVLFEKLIATSTKPDDYLMNLYDFLEEFHERYNETISTDSIIDLCQLARS